MNFYNDFDKNACAWMRELAAQGHIPAGKVSQKSITEIEAHELEGFRQIHFFAGIGGWPLALRLAGWPEDREVWTGSCPCQPFSAAGNRKGQADERHLWPAMFQLIRQQRPQCVFGEQVAAAIGHGWLDGVFADLEGEGYACGAVVLGAHSVGAPHIRQRLWWVAYTSEQSSQRNTGGLSTTQERIGCSHGPEHGHCVERLEHGGSGCGLGLAASERPQGQQSAGSAGGPVERARSACGMGNAECFGQERDGNARAHGAIESNRPHANAVETTSPWSDYIIIPCADGKARRIEPSISPLVDGVPARVGRLRGYGNAIVPQVAAAFIQAVMEEIGGAA